MTLCTFSVRLRRFHKSGGKAFARRSKNSGSTVLDGGDPEMQIQTAGEKPIQMSSLAPVMPLDHQSKFGATYSEVTLPQATVQH